MARHHSDSITLYHHTDSESAIQIVLSGYIKQSEGSGDAAFGYGVYLTEVGPSSSRSMVAKNNFDDGERGWISKIRQGKTDVAIEIKIRKSLVQKCNTKRNVYLYPGDLSLSDVEDWSVIERE